MFTGIVESLGEVASLEREGEGGRITIRAPEIAPSLAVAGSIAVNGCCLTVVACDAQSFSADLSAETLRRTALGDLAPGRRVNLERPLTAGKEFGGHFVQGHVDGVGHVTRLEAIGDAKTPSSWWLSVRVPDELTRYVAIKGSLAIDGISLTVANLHDDVVDVAVIPFTYEHTNVRDLKAGDAVNLECDVLAKYVERLLEARGEAQASGLTVERLREQGF
jgi:riboflavin synthase